MAKVSELFEVRYGVTLELNALEKDPFGINFVSRTAKNNGVAARVKLLDCVEPNPVGSISVAGGGSVMESFLQPEPYYSGFHLFCLVPHEPMTDAQKLYYCTCLRANKYRFNYGRQANRTLRDLVVPELADIPAWVDSASVSLYDGADAPATAEAVPVLNPEKWVSFKFSTLFDIRKGKRLTKADMLPGTVPFIGATDSNNGFTAFIGQPAIHEAGTITVNYNGNGVAEAYYQPVPYWATDDINVLYPRFTLSPARALFIATVIRMEKYRFSYGRKWHLERMKESTIKLPVTADGNPDWQYMEIYIKALPFSSQL
ncbi:MAG: restriction endonuclease subunit S [Geobacteraceae bacterium]|nr:restriction endonuclease subunit S [Geobacteraceae bacterium]